MIGPFNDLRARFADVPSASRRRAAMVVALLFILGALTVFADDLDVARGRRRPPPPPREVAIVNVALPSVGLRTPDGWSKTVLVDEKTRIHEGPRDVDASAIAVGRRAVVRDRPDGKGAFVAVDINLLPKDGPPPPRERKGLLTLLGFGGLYLALRLARRKRLSA